jgi:DNA repair protein RecO (recombination protein O)
MAVSAKGIVLRKVAYSSSSAIVTVYTNKFGTTPFMVRGIGKKRSGKSAALQPLSRIEFNCNYREKNQVQALSDLSLIPGSSNFSFHPLKSVIALFLAEMLFRSLREESKDEDLFDFLDTALDFFSEDEFSPDFHLIFLIKLSRFFGFYPSGKWQDSSPYFDLLHGGFSSNPNQSVHTLSEELSKSLGDLLRADFGDKVLQRNNASRRALLNAIVEYYQIHLEGLGQIKSLPVLVDVFSE